MSWVSKEAKKLKEQESVCLVRCLGMTLKKTTKIIKIHEKVTVFWDIFKVFYNIGWKTVAQTN